MSSVEGENLILEPSNVMRSGVVGVGDTEIEYYSE